MYRSTVIWPTNRFIYMWANWTSNSWCWIPSLTITSLARAFDWKKQWYFRRASQVVKTQWCYLKSMVVQIGALQDVGDGRANSTWSKQLTVLRLSRHEVAESHAKVLQLWWGLYCAPPMQENFWPEIEDWINLKEANTELPRSTKVIGGETLHC